MSNPDGFFIPIEKLKYNIAEKIKTIQYMEPPFFLHFKYLARLETLDSQI